MEALRQEFGARLGEGLTLRPLGEEDLPQVLELYEGNAFYNSVALDRQPDLALCREDLEALPPGKTREEKLFLGVFRQGRLAAVLDLIEGYPQADTLYLGLLELQLGEQGKGLGTGLMGGLEAAGRAAGFSFLRLGCLEANLPGLGFWRARGFVEEGRGLWEGRPVHKLKKQLNPEPCKPGNSSL